jgi:hypothetical protein
MSLSFSQGLFVPSVCPEEVACSQRRHGITTRVVVAHEARGSSLPWFDGQGCWYSQRDILRQGLGTGPQHGLLSGEEVA